MSSFDDEVAARAVDAVVTLSALRETGATRSAIAHRVRSGRWLRPHREVYVVVQLIEDPVRTSARGSLAAVPMGAVASHLSAGHLHRLAGLPALVTPAVTMPPDLCRRRVSGLLVHGSARLESVDVGGLQVTPVLRTIADLSHELTPGQLLSAMDSALRRGDVSAEELATLGHDTPATRAVVLQRRLGPLADGRSESPLESIIRLLLLEAGLGPMSLQVEVWIDGRCYRIDLGYLALRVGIEADGRAYHSSPEALLGDRRRQNALLAAGWLLLRFTWDDVINRPTYVVATVRAALAARSAA